MCFGFLAAGCPSPAAASTQAVRLWRLLHVQHHWLLAGTNTDTGPAVNLKFKLLVTGNWSSGT
eukprot:3888071-Rhodomonas_salina.1